MFTSKVRESTGISTTDDGHRPTNATSAIASWSQPTSGSPSDARASLLARARHGFYLRSGKRIFDIATSALGLLILTPVLLIATLLLKLTSPGPVLYAQERVGKGGRLFKILKFRSMVSNADAMGPAVTAATDPRVTALGKVLRRWKIDEFPQLWNVLKGDMSLVGPRPEVPFYVAGYTDQQRLVLSVRPGITDLASIEYRNEEDVLGRSPNPEQYYREVVLPHKLTLNLEYLDQTSLSFDLLLILKTARRLFSVLDSTNK